jgi:exodeoxyribonuclease III
MRIISWNCCWQKGGFTEEKRNEILKLNPDILIVQECKQDDWQKLGYSDKNGHWYGDGKESQGDPNKNLGIGIYCNDKYTIDCSLFEGQDLSNMRYALPYIIKYQDEEILTLFSVWAKSGYEYYHVPILNSLEYFYKKTKSFVVVAGDFNTGSQYNKETARYYEFIKNELETKYGLGNCAYFWQEWSPTFCVEKDGNYEFYLDDHCFFEKPNKVLSFGIGDWRYWCKYSDHMPLIIDLEDNLYPPMSADADPNLFLEHSHNEVIVIMHRAIDNSESRNAMKDFKLADGLRFLKYGDYTKEL